MSDWTWEYDPDAQHVIGGLSPGLRREVETLAQRLADAAAVAYVGDPDVEDSGVGRVKFRSQGHLLVAYLEHRRLRLVLIVRVQHLRAD